MTAKSAPVVGGSQNTEKPVKVRSRRPGIENLTNGRPLGVKNKITRTIKDELLAVYNDIGGGKALAKWAKENPGEFYTKLWIKALPVKLVGDPDQPIQFEVIIRPHGTVNEALPAIEHGVTVEGAEYEVDQ